MNDILTLSGVAQAGLIRQGAISAVELVEAHLARIDEVNPTLNAVVQDLRDSARLAACEADRRRLRGESIGPFDGVPFSIKDSIDVEGTSCTAGTLGFRDRAPATRDAALVARIRAAGGIPIAKTNLPDLLYSFESGNLIYGRTNNPFDRTRTSGGSSGGEAALIASGGSAFGLGSDCAGSVRLPAHFCGIASIKPTSGRLPRTGHVPGAGGWAEALWQIGPMARSVADLEALMPLLIGPDGEDHTVIDMPYRTPGENLRIAYFTGNGIAPVDADTERVVRSAAAALGAVEDRMPGIEETYDIEMKMLGPDGGDGLREYLTGIGSLETHPLLDSWIEKLEPFRTDLAGFTAYWAELHNFRARMCEFLRGYDAILSPVCASPAIPHGASAADAVFRGFSYTMTYNLTGLPAAVVRFGESSEGLPIGVQIAAHPFREDIALALARRLETATPGRYGSRRLASASSGRSASAPFQRSRNRRNCSRAASACPLRRYAWPK